MFSPNFCPSGHAFARYRGPFDGGDDLLAPDGVGEVGHGASHVFDICRERRVGRADDVGGRSFQTRERGPSLCQRCRQASSAGSFLPFVPIADERSAQSSRTTPCLGLLLTPPESGYPMPGNH